MKILYLDCGMGIAGDMLMAALYELLPEKQFFWNQIEKLGLEDVSIQPVPMQKCGIQGTHMKVLIHGIEEDSIAHEHNQHHLHQEHSHSHSHTSLKEIENIIDVMQLSDSIKQQALFVYTTIAEAESKAHNRPIDQIHFHEVGEKDAIADIIGNLILLDLLHVDAVYASPINTGFGKVHCAHGILPVPAPATASILTGIPIYAGRFEGELCTPTGAALYKNIVTKTCQMPPMVVEATGIGCGKKEFEAANILRAMLGTTYEQQSPFQNANHDTVVELVCNLDDCTGEEIAYAVDLFLEKGALDVYTTPIQMKKGRPATKLSLLCHPAKQEFFTQLILKHTTTLGVRATTYERTILERETIVKNTAEGPVRVKIATGFGITKEKPEFDDLKSIADKTGKSLQEVRGELF